MLKEDFQTFFSNIQLNNLEEMNITIKEITKKLNKYYYDIENEEEHMYIVGSVGRGTAIYFLIYQKKYILNMKIMKAMDNQLCYKK